jgi:hypothetical protein
MARLQSTAAAFIQQQSADMPATDVVRAAARAGLIITAKQVWAARERARSQGKPLGAAPPAAQAGARVEHIYTPRSEDTAAAASAEDAFKAAALRVGVERALALLGELQQRYSA